MKGLRFPPHPATTISLPSWSVSAGHFIGIPAMLDTFEISQTQAQEQTSTSLSQMIFHFSVFVALGVLFVVLAVSILTHRIWR